MVSKKGAMWGMLLGAAIFLLMLFVVFPILEDIWKGSRDAGACGAFTSAECFSQKCTTQDMTSSGGTCDSGLYCCVVDVEKLLLKKATEADCMDTPYVDFSVPHGRNDEKLVKYACIAGAEDGDFIVSRLIEMDDDNKFKGEVWEESFVFDSNDPQKNKVKVEIPISDEKVFAWHVIQYGYYNPEENGPDQLGQKIGESKLRIEVS